jgi:hypothetical protein
MDPGFRRDSETGIANTSSRSGYLPSLIRETHLETAGDGFAFAQQILKRLLSSWHRYRRPRVAGASLDEASAPVARGGEKDQEQVIEFPEFQAREAGDNRWVTARQSGSATICHQRLPGERGRNRSSTYVSSRAAARVSAGDHVNRKRVQQLLAPGSYSLWWRGHKRRWVKVVHHDKNSERASCFDIAWDSCLDKARNRCRKASSS